MKAISIVYRIVALAILFVGAVLSSAFANSTPSLGEAHLSRFIEEGRALMGESSANSDFQDRMICQQLGWSLAELAAYRRAAFEETQILKKYASFYQELVRLESVRVVPVPVNYIDYQVAALYIIGYKPCSMNGRSYDMCLAPEKYKEKRDDIFARIQRAKATTQETAILLEAVRRGPRRPL